MLTLLAILSLAQPTQPTTPAAPSSPQTAPAPKTAPLPPGVIAQRDLEYALVNDQHLKLDIYRPEAINDGAPLPLIIWVHGGGWSAGSKDPCPIVSFARKDYIVASVQYRFTNVAPWPAQINDCKAAVRFLRAHAKEHHIDPARIGVWGVSAGGHLVAMLGMTGDVKELEGAEGNPDQTSRVQAVVDWFGPSDLLSFKKQQTDAALTDEPLTKSLDGVVAALLGGAPTDKPDIAKSASPVTYSTKDDAPTLIMHGDKDNIVPLAQSQQLLESLKAAGVEATLEVIHGEGHGFGAQSPAAIQKVRDFFDAKLRPAKPAEPPAAK